MYHSTCASIYHIYLHLSFCISVYPSIYHIYLSYLTFYHIYICLYTIIYIGHINELQITVTAHACDGLNDPTVAAVNAASYALLLSKQPWFGPIGCVRVGYIDGRCALY